MASGKGAVCGAVCGAKFVLDKNFLIKILG
jgi:hypothetical protein